MNRLLVAVLLTTATSAWADKQCSPFDQEPDGGSPLDNVACCEGAFNDDGCEPALCKNGSEPNFSRNVGKPVDTLSGFAWFQTTDVSLVQPWGPPVAFVRTYSTGWAQTHGGQDDVGALGPGWSHRWADHLILSGPPPASVVVLRRGDTGSEEHRFDGTKYVARSPNRQLRWDTATSTYTLEQPDGGWLIFDATGKLRTVRASDGGESQLHYVGEDATCAASASRPTGALCRVDFLFERSIWFDYDAAGHLVQVSWDSGASSVIARFGFDPAGYLTSTTKADTTVTLLAYTHTHAFPRLPGVTVKLLTLITDADGKLAESFGYYQPPLSPSRVIRHETPETQYQFSYGNWVGKPVRTTTVRSSKENLKLTWKNGNLASVCELDAAGICDVSKAREITVPPTGVSAATCTRDSAGNYTRIERDARGRKLAEYPGLKSCGAPTPTEALLGRTFGYLADTVRPAFEAVPSVDATAPPGFFATTVWDHTPSASAIDPYCGAPGCWTPTAYNAGPVNDRPQRLVQWGRTVVDENGTWGTQVQVTLWGYGPLGQLTTIDGPRRDVADLTIRTWYPAGAAPGPASLQQIQRAGRLIFQASDYDALGNARTTTDEAGLVTTRTFDAIGQLRSELQPGQLAPTTWEYAPSGRLTKAVDPSGATTQSKYDSRGRMNLVERVTHPPTVDSYLALNLAGFSPPASATDYELGNPVRSSNFGYDAQGRQVATMILRTTLAASQAAGVRYAHYDGDGQIDWKTDEGWLTTIDATAAKAAHNREYSYGANGRPVEERERIRGIWVVVGKMTWDVQGQLASYTDARGVKVRYLHDDFGRLVELESPDFGLIRYVYDEAGNVVKQRRADGTVTSYTYDASNRLIEALTVSTPEAFEWNTVPAVTDCAGGMLPVGPANGRLTHATDASGDWYFGYWPSGLLRFEGFVRAGTACAQTVLYEWTPGGQLGAVRYPSGARLEYVFPTTTQNRQDLPISLNLVVKAQTRPLLTGLTFEASRAASYLTPGGIKWALRRYYDGAPHDWTLSRQSPALGALGVVRSRKFGHTAANNTFTARFDGWGNPLEIEELLPQWSQLHIYDERPWMIGATGPWGTQAFEYLVNGDRRRTNGKEHCYEAGTHRLAQVGDVKFRSDPSGALWKRESLDGRATTYCWNPIGQLGSVIDSGGQATRCVYNYRGQRVSEVWPVNELRADYRVDGAGRLLSEELPGSLGQEFPRALREYVWVEDQPVAVVRSRRAVDGTVTYEGVTWIHGGHLGEPLTETDEFGHVLRNHAFEPFGARSELAIPVVLSQLATKNPYTVEALDVASPGTRAMRVHLAEVQLGTCDAVQVIDWATNTTLGEVLPGSPSDQWLGPYPTDRVRLQLSSKGCGAGRGFKILETQSEVGAQSVQTLTLKTTMPYPAAGVRFAFNLTRPTYFRLTSISLGTCDAIEARRVGTGEVLWKVAPKVFTGAMWTARLTGDIELGIWGVGCNATEKKNGFNLVQSMSEEANPPATSLALRGQRETVGGLHENWNRFYDPSLGRYLSPDPQALGAALTNPPILYSYADNAPVLYFDSAGRFSLKGDCPNYTDALRIARSYAGCSGTQTSTAQPKSCKCKAKIDECPAMKGCNFCSALGEGSKPPLNPTKDLTYLGEKANGLTQFSSSGKGVDYVKIELALCGAGGSGFKLARTLLHEVAHICSRDITDDVKTDSCSAACVAATCMEDANAIKVSCPK